MMAVYMKSGTADELIRIRLHDCESLDILTNIHVGTMQERPVVRETVYKLIDRLCIP
jgi:hypothetical protein